MADTIANSEAGRYISTKPNVGELADIHVDDEPHEDGAELAKTSKSLLLSILQPKTLEPFLMK